MRDRDPDEVITNTGEEIKGEKLRQEFKDKYKYEIERNIKMKRDKTIMTIKYKNIKTKL
jgi:hypothetical protein